MNIGKTEVYKHGPVTIVKVSGYGFNCNTVSNSWQVFYNGEFYWQFTRLKDAKKVAANLAAEVAA